MSRALAAVLLAALAAPWLARAADAGPEAADAGAPIERRGREEAPRPLAPTADLGALSIRHLHVVLERKGDRLEVSEMMTFASRPGTRFESPRGVRVALPAGAVAPRTFDADGARLAAAADAGGVVISDPIGPGGHDLSISFEVPIAGGAAAFRQRLPVAAASFQVVSTWTSGRADLRVAGAGAAVRDELENGLVALIAEGAAVPGGALDVRVTGIADGAEAWPRRAALALCVALLAAGARAFARRRRRERGGGA
jgi:hypothetical protein